MKKLSKFEIDEITKKLFSINYITGNLSDEFLDEYEVLAHNTLEKSLWTDVFNSWYRYLFVNCKTEDEVINFADLLSIYTVNFKFKRRFCRQQVPDPTNVIAYLILKIDIKKNPYEEGLIEGLACVLFRASRLRTSQELYDYSPLADPLVMEAVERLRKENSEYSC